jgi:hypothetical protein
MCAQPGTKFGHLKGLFSKFAENEKFVDKQHTCKGVSPGIKYFVFEFLFGRKCVAVLLAFVTADS